jgi:competence protein ComEC
MTVGLIYSPLAILETGFWLSVGAGACLIWCGQTYQFRWQDAVKLQFLLLIGMLPLYLFFFSGFSLIAPLVNIVAIPLVSLIVPLEFLNLLSNGALAAVVDTLVLFFWWLVEQCSELSWAFVEVQELELSALIMLLLASLILLLPSGFLPKSFALFLAMPVLFGVENETDDHFQAWIFDVGQGLAILIEQQDYRLLYDTGPSYRTGGNAFDRAVLPYLESKGIQHIDHVVLSHDDNDHVGGFGHLAEGFSLGKVTTSFESDYSNNRCLGGDRWLIGGVHYSFLSGSEGSEDNDRSCVLLVESENCSLLLPGDISAKVEDRLLFEKNVSWLVASHHGSKSSTSQVFLNKVSPDVIIYSAGYGNPFNHPHPDVVERSKRTDANLYSTAVNGAVLLRSTKHLGCESSAFRSNKKRFWRSFQSL